VINLIEHKKRRDEGLMSKVNLLIAKTPKEKLHHIKTICQKLFDEGKRFTLLAPNEEALKFLDNYLWTDDLFIPHAIATRASDEFAVLTTSSDNLNKSIACVNVCANLAPLHFEEIYDLLDFTTPEKSAQSSEKQKLYAPQLTAH